MAEWRNASAVLAIASLLFPGPANSQECPANVSAECTAYLANLAPGVCLRPGSVFVLKEKWESAERTRIKFSGQKRVQFFYVVDGTSGAAKFDILFVSIDRVGQQTTQSNVKLTRNQTLSFKSKEEKQKYSRALRPGGQPTQPMRQWSYVPEVGNVFLVKENSIISEFDIPQAINDIKHTPHARLYRYETGNISCIPFRAGLHSDVDLILGKVVDTSGPAPKTVLFRVTIE
jgi:hypothetical protein